MSDVTPWLDPETCPAERPPLARMGSATRELHTALDARARTEGVAWLHPDHRTIQRDLLGSPNVVAWQEAKQAFMIRGDGAWSELPHLYARYGTPATAELIAALRELEGARTAFVTDCGMQAFALVADVLLVPGSHAVVLRQVYNKTKTFMEWSARRVGATVTFVDDGDPAAVAAAITPATRFVFAETFTNPLMRAQDIPALVAGIRAKNPTTVLVIDSTIATPWAFRQPLLAGGVGVVIGSLTKSLGGQDAALGGYIATDDADLGNQIMDLIAMRGGILDDARARAVVPDLVDGTAAARHARRCTTAARVANFLASHPRVERACSPSLPDHPDAAVIARDYARTGSIVAFRVTGADELRHRHIADVLASCGVLRYALSFDGLPTKINHHRTVSEYFTPAEVVARAGIDRLVRVAIGIEDADDLIACLNWTLHHEARVTTADLDAWRAARAAELGLSSETAR
ncbi:MAG: PLP-dependent transferase [Deltaproteobacteria bacterium]|nr:PLP-dependent transferase [Deltaproteobacteria bacterium]MDQ3297552.1 PLP-dependent transferase [Myxococcota bacterium]